MGAMGTTHWMRLSLQGFAPAGIAGLDCVWGYCLDSTYAVGAKPVQRLNAREKALRSAKPKRNETSFSVFEPSRSIFPASSQRTSWSTAR